MCSPSFFITEMALSIASLGQPARTHLSCIVDIMATGISAKQGAGASASTPLTWLSGNSTVSAPENIILAWIENAVHQNDVIMSNMASQITSFTMVYTTVSSGADQRKHQSSASLAFVWGIHRWPVNSPHERPVTRKMFPFDDVIMVSQKPCIRVALFEFGCIITHIFRSVIFPQTSCLLLWQWENYIIATVCLQVAKLCTTKTQHFTCLYGCADWKMNSKANVINYAGEISCIYDF